MATDLLFASALNTAHPVNLTFGAGDAAVTYSYLTMSAVVPPPTVSGHIIDVAKLAIVATVPAPAMSASMVYDNAVYRGVVGQTSNDWQDANRLVKATSDKTEPVVHIRSTKNNHWKLGSRSLKSTSLFLANARPVRNAKLSQWDDGTSLKNQVASGFQMMTPRPRPSIVTKHSVAVPVSKIDFSGWEELLRRPRPTLATTWGQTIGRGVVKTTHMGVGKPLSKRDETYWQTAVRPFKGIHTIPVIPPIPGCYVPPDGANVDLLFNESFVLSTNVVFRCGHYTPPPDAAIVVPIRSTYIVINNITLKRVSDDAQIPDVTLMMSIDMDSWTWGFSASLPASVLSLVAPDASGNPTLLEASVNGVPYRFIAESIKRDRTFGKSTITVTGRGQSALLSDPYSPVMGFANSESRTAQQLMNDTLMFNGVPIGWDIDWRLEDWTVPTGVWSHQGTYMSAVTMIAAAAGGFVQPHATSQTLLILPRNQVTPWTLSAATPDIELPSAPIIQESISWENRAEYDSVYVSGSSAGGVLGQVKRIGSGGTKPAPMVTDALITDVIAARQRGIYELSRFGRVVKYQLNLPILPETGIIMPGKIVRYSDDGILNTGVVDSVQVNVALPSASQTINITTYV